MTKDSQQSPWAEGANFGQCAFSRDQESHVSSLLERQLGLGYVSTRQGAAGMRINYLEGNRAIELANKIFGFNGWSTRIVDLQVDFCDEVNGRVSLGVSCTTRVTLKDGTYKEDVGYGSIVNCKAKGDAYQKAKKEAVTDSLKRCLRLFGNALGNCLYDKTYIQNIHKPQMRSQMSLLNPDTEFAYVESRANFHANITNKSHNAPTGLANVSTISQLKETQNSASAGDASFIDVPEDAWEVGMDEEMLQACDASMQNVSPSIDISIGATANRTLVHQPSHGRDILRGAEDTGKRANKSESCLQILNSIPSASSTNLSMRPQSGFQNDQTFKKPRV
ncbi:hypothetical protein MP228_003822 [Amoeboaphelidium protococcarum]|nr:hypothetical protein MP228_003822 [Amoeboaphelidium protococcarum]